MRRLIASWFGSGLLLGRLRGSHLGSGTIASVLAFPVAVLIGVWGGWQAQLIATMAIIAVAFWSATPLVAEEGDAGWIVIDEVAGLFLATIGLGWWPGAVVALIVFRLADIYKNAAPGVARAELLPGAVGVIGDDLVAGLYGLAAGLIAQTLL